MIAFSAAAAGLAILLLLSNLTGLAQLQLADMLYAPRPLSDSIVIVAVDDKSLMTEKDGGLGPYENWTREKFATVLNNLNKYSPAVIGLDFYFRTEKNADGDAKLKEALSKTKNPVVIYRANEEYDLSRQMFIQKKEDDVGFELPTEKVISPNTIVAAAKALPDPDNTIRRLPVGIFNEKENKFFDNLPMAIAKAFLNKDLTIPIEDGEMLINYVSKPGESEYKHISFGDLYNENYSSLKDGPEQFLKDKIVLIGPVSFYFKDTFFTPANKITKMSGIAIHANAIQTILDQKFLINENTLWKILVILIVAFLSAFVFLFCRIRWIMIFTAVFLPAYALLAIAAFNNGLIIDLVHPYLVILWNLVVVNIYRYFTEFKEKLALKDAFSKYVNPKLAEEIASNPSMLKLGGEKRDITVLFTDIEGFTSISEKLLPESLVALLNEYFEAMTNVIMNEGGTLDKYEGDAIMSFFGAPIASADHAFKACVTALKMRQALQVLLDKWKNDPPLPGGEAKPMINFRCGINSGEVIVGNLGSKEKFNYTVIGDAVNLGSRLEAVNKMYKTRIIISDFTYQQIKDQFITRELDVIRVVGKKEPVQIYELLSLKEGFEGPLDMIDQFEEGLRLYHERNFKEALVLFTSLLEKFPDDEPSKIYRQRCEILRDFPPKENWDGVFEMKNK